MVGPAWWARALAAATFWSAAYLYLTIPDVRPLITENPRTTAFMELREAQQRADADRSPRRQRWVAYNRISANLRRAVLVAEDSAFWQHDGIDLEQIRESIEVNLERLAFARGASTITQQLAKNLYLSPSKNPVRKVRELLITRRLEAVLTKRRILELYLNVIEWGDGIWGADAAARAYFRKPAAALSAEEAALLAGAIINPRLLNPGRPTARLRRRQRLLLRQMAVATPPSERAVPATAPARPVPLESSPPAVATDGGPEPQELAPDDSFPLSSPSSEPDPAPREEPPPGL